PLLARRAGRAPGGRPCPGGSRIGNVELVILSVSGHAEDDGADALLAPEAVTRVRLDVHHRPGLNVDHLLVQFHLAPTLKNVVNLGALSVVMLYRVSDEGDVQVAGHAVGARQGTCALPTGGVER